MSAILKRSWWLVLSCMAVGTLHAAPSSGAYFSQLEDPWLGKPVYVVDRLDDYSAEETPIPQTLRWALEQLRADGGIVVFRRSGTIRLQGRLRIPAGVNNWLIAGYTAPAPGINITQHGLDVAGQYWAIEHVRIRPGAAAYTSADGDMNDALGITGERETTLTSDPDLRQRLGIRNGRIVNCSFAWASDELVQLWFPPIENVDFVRCIFNEPLHDPNLHPKPEVHGFGPLLAADVGPVGFTECLFANSLRRNPRINDGCRAFIGNCVIFNPGGAGIELRNAAVLRPAGRPPTPRLPGSPPPRPLMLAVTHTLFVPGTDTQPATNLLTQGESLNPESRLYVRDNFRWLKTGEWQAIADADALEAENGVPFAGWQDDFSLSPPGFSALAPRDVESRLQAAAGAFPRSRDAVDRRALAQLADRSGRRILRPTDAGLARFDRPHDSEGYEILPVIRWPEGNDVVREWALPRNTLDPVAMGAWLEAKRRLADH